MIIIRYFILFFLYCLFLSTEAETKSLIVMLDWQLNPDHAPLFVAAHYGFFKAQGLEVHWVTPADPSDPPKFAAIGKVDLAITYEPQWVIQKRQGLPLAWVATLVGQPLMALMTQDKLSDLKPLRGQSIGYSLGGASEIILQTMLQQDGLSIHDVIPVNVHYDLLQAFAAKRVMAISGVMRNVEPIELDQKKCAYRLFYPEQRGVPSFAELIFVTNTAHAQDPRFIAFRRAMTQAVAYLKAHPEQTWQTFVSANPALNNETNHKIWLASIPYFDEEPGRFNQEQYNRLKTFLIRLLQNPILPPGFPVNA